MSAVVPDWYEQNLKIRTKLGKIVPFKANTVQRKLRKILNRQLKEKRRVRAIICKYRQGGISTEVQAEFFRIIVTAAGVEALVMAHDIPGANAVFRRTVLFKTTCPIQRPTKRNNAKEIEYDPPHLSAIRVGVASDAGFGRGDTRHLVHFSEMAHWGEKAGEIYSGVTNSVSDSPGSIIVTESTANGHGNLFHSEWMAAINGESDFEPIFLSWLEEETYRLDVALDDPRWRNLPSEWFDDEEDLRALGADDHQLAWRRWAIGSKCRGSVDLYKQEYPATWQEAFLSSGSPVFPKSIVVTKLAECTQQERSKPAQKFTINAKDEIELDRRGLLRVWQRPEKGVAYLVTADVARGVQVDGQGAPLERLDYSTAGVLRRDTLEEVAVWHGRIDPDLFGGQILWNLGRWYGNAELCPESNHYGVIAIKALLRRNYPRVFRKEKHNRPTRSPVDQGQPNFMEYGWWTGSNGVEKLVMISNLNQLIRERRIVIHEPEAWEEMLSFERLPDGSLGAKSGCHDDRVMRLAIASTLMITHPPVVQQPQQQIQDYSWAWFEKRAEERDAATSGGGGLVLS